nr:uncharacterized protein LOC117281913 [Nicotiana tomentosiformis]
MRACGCRSGFGAFGQWPQKRRTMPASARNIPQKRLEESKGNWPEVLPGVLWAYRTRTKTGTGETPFSLVYGSEALIPVEIGEPSTRFTQATEESNDEELRANLDLLEQRREAALIRMAAQKQTIE